MLTDILIANRTEAAAVNAAGGTHLRTWTGIEGGGVDPAMLGPLWQVLSGEAVDHRYMTQPLDQRSPEGPWAILLPEAFVAKLAALEGDALTTAAGRWAVTDECSRSGATASDAAAYLGSLAKLSRQAKAQSKDLLLRVAM